MEVEIKAQIRSFLTRFFEDDDIQDDEDILALGFVSSLLAIQLVLFVEQTFQISIENEDMDLDNFRTINALTNLIRCKQGVILSAQQTV